MLAKDTYFLLPPHPKKYLERLGKQDGELEHSLKCQGIPFCQNCEGAGQQGGCYVTPVWEIQL